MDSKVKKSPIAGGRLPNGIELFSKEEGMILVTDSEIGGVWKVNISDPKAESILLELTRWRLRIPWYCNWELIDLGSMTVALTEAIRASRSFVGSILMGRGGLQVWLKS